MNIEKNVKIKNIFITLNLYINALENRIIFIFTSYLCALYIFMQDVKY